MSSAREESGERTQPVRAVADERRAATAVPVPTGCRVAIRGVKGGGGVTTVALLLGLTLAQHRDQPVIVADDTLGGSLALRAGMPLPADPLIRPAGAHRAGIGIGCIPPITAPLCILDDPAPTVTVGVEVLVVAARVDAVLMADSHRVGLVVLTQPTLRSPVVLDAAATRLADRGATVITVPFDAHLAVGGPICWDRLVPPTRDASRQLAATVITALAGPPLEVPVPPDQSKPVPTTKE